MSDPNHLKLAGVTKLEVASTRGVKDVYLFDPHRLALPCWWLALERAPSPAALLTLDRHFDLVVPRTPEAVPDRSQGLRAIDEHARWSLDVRNFDHVLAAVEAGLFDELFVVARAWPRETGEKREAYEDRRGTRHRIHAAVTIDRVSEGWRTPNAAPAARALAERIDQGHGLVLDVDVDCFTTPSDADPTAIVPWPEALIREFLLPPESETFWNEVLAATKAITIAREPYHTGGVLAGNRLFESFAKVFFGELLGAELP